MFLFIVALLVLLGSLIAFPLMVSRYRGSVLVAGILFAILLLFLSCIRTVGTKEIGVPTTFGKVGTKHYSAGPHLVWPWVKLHEMDGAIQTDDHLNKACFQVRISNQQTGCAEVSMQWRINPKWVDYDYQNYRSFSHLTTQLVDRKLFSAVNTALAGYNPLNTVATTTKKNPLPGFQNTIYRLMKQKVRDINGEKLIEILNVQLPIVHFDPETQSRINQLQQQVALTKIAGQTKDTNKAKAAANTALATKSLTPAVLTSRCLDSLDAMIKARQAVPAGFSCGLGAGIAGIIAK